MLREEKRSSVPLPFPVFPVFPLALYHSLPALSFSAALAPPIRLPPSLPLSQRGYERPRIFPAGRFPPVQKKTNHSDALRNLINEA